MRRDHLVACLLVIVFLAACGARPGERSLSGAGVGAGVGALGTAIVGGSVLTGAAVGAAAGAVIGAVSDPRKINLD